MRGPLAGGARSEEGAAIGPVDLDISQSRGEWRAVRSSTGSRLPRLLPGAAARPPPRLRFQPRLLPCAAAPLSRDSCLAPRLRFQPRLLPCAAAGTSNRADGWRGSPRPSRRSIVPRTGRSEADGRIRCLLELPAGGLHCWVAQARLDRAGSAARPRRAQRPGVAAQRHRARPPRDRARPPHDRATPAGGGSASGRRPGSIRRLAQEPVAAQPWTVRLSTMGRMAGRSARPVEYHRLVQLPPLRQRHARQPTT